MAEGLRSKRRKMNEQVSSVDTFWSNLPSVPLVKIYSFLSRRDQITMSWVCKHWSEGFKHPSLWKFIEFTFCGEESSLKPWILMKFVNFQGLRHVRIDCDWSLSSTDRRAIKTFKDLLNTLKIKSQLISVEIGELRHLLVYGRNAMVRKSVCKVIENFLASQHRLQQVNFFLCPFNFEEGLTLLKKLVEHSRDSIRHLSLKEFVRNDYNSLSQEEQEQLLSIIIGLPNLVCLEIDYTWLVGRNGSPSNVKEFFKNYKNRLVLYTYGFFDWYTAGGWKRPESIDRLNLIKENSGLQINLFIRTVPDIWKQRDFLIMPDMPIKTLYLYHHNWQPRSEIAVFFTHLLSWNTNKHLVSLALAIDSPIPDFAASFLTFINACEQLEEISLETVYPADGLSVFLESLTRSTPNSFQKFKLHVSGIGKGEEKKKEKLNELTSSFVQVLNIEINLVFKVYYIN